MRFDFSYIIFFPFDHLQCWVRLESSLEVLERQNINCNNYGNYWYGNFPYLHVPYYRAGKGDDSESNPILNALNFEMSKLSWMIRDPNQSELKWSKIKKIKMTTVEGFISQQK